MYKLCKFQVNLLFVTDFMNLQSSKSGCVNYARFRKSGHILCWHIIYIHDIRMYFYDLLDSLIM